MAIVVRDAAKQRTIVVIDTDKPMVDLSQDQVTMFLEAHEDSKHIVKISDKDIKTITEKEIFNWCWENVERDCHISFLTGEEGHILAHFEQDTDAVAFKLRWM